MGKVACYQLKDSGISIVHPVDDNFIHEIAQRSVPAGVPYVVIEFEDLPPDSTYNLALELDTSNPSGYGTNTI